MSNTSASVRRRATLHRVTATAMRLGVYEPASLTEHRLIEFLAESRTGDWTVNGKFDSIEHGLCWRVGSPYRTVKRALANLAKHGVIEITKVGYTTTYTLSSTFRQRCLHMYRVRTDQAAVQQQRATRGPDGGPRVAPASRGTEKTPNGVFTESRLTADAARPVGREGELMTDYPTDDGFYGTPKKGRRSGEAPALGEDTTKPLGETKVVRGAKPTSAVTKTRERFVAKFTPLSEQHKIPLMGSRAKMHANIKLMLDDGYSDDIIDRAWEYFAGLLPSMYLGGTTLWDLFFAQRDEALKFAHVASIGSHGGPREDRDVLAKRLMTRSLRKDA